MKHGPEMLGYVGCVCVLTPISLSRSSDPFLSSAYCGLTSIIRLLLESSLPFTPSSQFYYFLYSAQFLAQIFAPYLFVWTIQG